MVSIVVVRHAESVWNSEGRWQGHADPPLSEAGTAQARAAARSLSDVRQIASSDLLRARETAAILADASGTGSVVLDAGLRERNIGPWQGMTTAEIERDYPGALGRGERPPGWESDELLLGRIFPAIHRLAQQSGSGDVVAVSHAGVLYALEGYFGCEFERISNLHGRRILVTRGEVSLGERIALIDDGACLTSTATTERR